jgi:hypothetical protein
MRPCVVDCPVVGRVKLPQMAEGVKEGNRNEE